MAAKQVDSLVTAKRVDRKDHVGFWHKAVFTDTFKEKVEPAPGLEKIGKFTADGLLLDEDQQVIAPFIMLQ